jgi:hypothetical protein
VLSPAGNQIHISHTFMHSASPQLTKHSATRHVLFFSIISRWFTETKAEKEYILVATPVGVSRDWLFKNSELYSYFEIFRRLLQFRALAPGIISKFDFVWALLRCTLWRGPSLITGSDKKTM